MAKSIQIAGGNNVTLSTSTAADATSFTISGPNTHAQQTGISGVSNSQIAYTSGTVRLSGENNITVRSETGQAFVISGPNTHAQQTAISGLGNSETTYTSGTVNLSVVGGPITIRSTTGNAFQFSASQSVQPETQTFIGGIRNTETTYTSGTVELEGTNNITVFSTTGQRFRISGANTHAQQTAISGLGNSETTYTSGTVNFSALANITIRSTTGNAFQFSVAGGGAGFSAGASNLGNTAGDTGVTGTRLVLVGTNAVSLSQSTDANGGTVSVNVTHTTHDHTNLSAGVSTGGNTQGNTTVNTGSRLVFVGTNNITLSQGTAAGATTISISGPNPGGGGAATLDQFLNFDLGVQTVNADIQSTSQLSARTGSVIVQPLMGNYDLFPGVLTANTAYLKFSVSGSTATMSAANTTTVFLGVYTQNVSTLSLLNSASTTWGGAAATNNSTSTVGQRWLSFHSSLWSAQPVFNQSHYYWAVLIRTSGVQNQTFGMVGNTLWQSASQATDSGTMGVATVASATSRGMGPWYGVYSASSASLPASIGSNQLNKQTDVAIFNPLIYLLRTGPQTF